MAQISSGPVGILPGQNMFETDSTRKGILEARESFVRMVNVIFARNPVAIDRPDAVAALDVETPVNEYMIWRQDAGVRHTQPPPATSEYDIEVFSVEEMESLLTVPSFLNDLMVSSKRVLVNGLHNDVPQWSVWDALLTPSSSIENPDPDEIFTLARTYDFPKVDDAPLTMADRNRLINIADDFSTGSRVLVQGDTSTGGFWTIWEYSPSDPMADDHGFVLIRTQTYRTKDFWDFVDWYADGYGVANPPVVRYPNAAARNAAENPVPNTKFVRLDDDGNGRWAWTIFEDGAWNVVAREKGTIRLSEKLYDTSREVLFDPTGGRVTHGQMRRVFNREGSWELRVLFDALRDASAFYDIEINEVFFSMLHFVHAQQDQVPWAFKTSFLTIGGYNEPLRPVPVQPVDNTQNLLDYIEEVKPYRVKTRDFTRVVAPDIDVANIIATDFDLPPYFDEMTGKYRILSIGNSSDLEIIKNTKPWKDWYDNYQKPIRNPSDYTPSGFNPVRQMNITMMFDRVDHMPILFKEEFIYDGGDLAFRTENSLDGRILEVTINGKKTNPKYVSGSGNSLFLNTPGVADGSTIQLTIRQGLSFMLAGDRIERFYDPVRAEKNVRRMLGLEPKIGITDGGSFDEDSDGDYTLLAGEGDETINSNPHYGLADPRHGPDRPEELAVLGSSESIVIHVRETGGPNGDSNYVIANAMPTTDLLVVKETGDYDARPVDILPHDSGIIGATSSVAYIEVSSVDVVTIMAAVENAIDPKLVVIRKLRNGPQWRNNVAYKKGDVVRNGNNLYMALRDVTGGQITTLSAWRPYGAPTSLVTLSDADKTNAVVAALSGLSPVVKKRLDRAPVFAYRENAWEYLEYAASEFALLDSLSPTDDVIRVKKVPGANFEHYLTPPSYHRVAKTKEQSKTLSSLTDNKLVYDEPGIIWVNGERIEFFSIEDMGDHFDITNFKRGTNGTPISKEVRYTNFDNGTYPRGDGVNRIFSLEGNFTDLEGVDVILYAPLRNEDGSVRTFDYYSGHNIFIPKRYEKDYTLILDQGNIRVVFNIAPTNVANVVIAKTDNLVHERGSNVLDGRKKMDIRLDNHLGGMVHY